VNGAFYWRRGDEKLCRALEDALLASDPEAAGLEVLRERPGRSRLLRVRLANGDSLVLKHFFGPSHRRRRRVRLAAAIGRSAADREIRQLERLAAAGIAVSELCAAADLTSGARLIATRYIPGPTLSEALACGREERVALLHDVGALIWRLHQSGVVHGDLHGGNILAAEQGPVLLDLQAARAARSRSARMRDLAALDDSLSPSLSTADRVRLRAAALALQRPFDADARDLLREVGRRSAAHARAHAASRTRRAGAVGRRFAALEARGGRGLRSRELDSSAVLAALAASRPGSQVPGWSLLKSDGRSRVTAGPTEAGSFVVKTYRAPGLLRRAADGLRGSPARRAWLGGHGLRARGVACATPVAYVEWRRFGLPVASAAVFEDLRALASADRCPPNLASAAEVVDSLTRLVLKLHRRGIVHGDLKASHVLLGRRGGRLEAALIDLEGVRFEKRLGDAERIRALAELNASLPDAVADALRGRAFSRYSAALPFDRGSAESLRAIVATSLERRHRWTGSGCQAAREFRGRGRTDLSG